MQIIIIINVIVINSRYNNMYMPGPHSNKKLSPYTAYTLFYEVIWRAFIHLYSINTFIILVGCVNCKSDM